MDAPLTSVQARAFTIPTDAPEADGTIAWASTTLVLVEVEAAGRTGIGFTYASPAAAAVVNGLLAGLLEGRDALAVTAASRAGRAASRNVGYGGIAATAVSAADLALWDLKAKLLDLPLASLLGIVRERVPIYGSGGFTTYSDDRLRTQLAGWVDRDGCRAVKMKIGTDPGRDPARMAAAREAIGAAELFVDANGAFVPRQALSMAEAAAEHGVAWFEEPVSGDDLEGLRFVRDHGPASIDVAAGEYNWDLDDVRRMLAADAVDVMQADATRCGGVTGFLAAAALCDAFHVPLSSHCGPAMHLHVAAAAPGLRHMEWFHDHVRIESMLFDGAPEPGDGTVAPDLTRPGHGLTFRDADARRFAV